MQILRPSFVMITIVGLWVPYSLSSSSCKRAMYNFYTAFIFLLHHTFLLSQFLDMVINVQTSDEFTDNIYLLLAIAASCVKINTILLNRQGIKTFIQALEEEPCKPLDIEEIKIQEESNKSFESTTIALAILVEGTVAYMALMALIMGIKERKLAYRVWLPYDYSSLMLYLVAFAHQTLGLFIASLTNISYDTIHCGFLSHACGQFDILKHRLKQITPETKNNIGMCVRHHNYIYEYVETVNKKFRVTTAIQFINSTLLVCFCLYEVSKTPPSNSRFTEFLMYMVTMMVEIYFYCWYGNQLKLKSMDFAYEIIDSDWIMLDTSTKRSLLMIMRRAMRPIESSYAHIIVMDLNTYVSLLKMSYSIFNLLQNSSD